MCSGNLRCMLANPQVNSDSTAEIDLAITAVVNMHEYTGTWLIDFHSLRWSFGSMVMFSELLVTLFSSGCIFETGGVQPFLQ
jgi:hypothetical protein